MYLYTQAVQLLKPLRAILEKGQKVEPDFNDVVLDLFALFYKAEPEFIEEAQTFRRYDYFHELICNRAICELRHKTRFHILNSFIEVTVHAADLLEHQSENSGQLKDSGFNCTLDFEKVHQALKGWGISTTQQTNMNLTQVIHLLNLVSQSPEFIKLAEQAGRLNQIARGVLSSKVSTITPTQNGVTLGNDILKTLPSELALLARKETEAAFYKKAMDSNLLVYDHKKREKLNRGPLIIFVDTSDSMSGEKGYVSKAIVACLHSIAQKEKRWLSVIVFSGGKRNKEFIFDPQKPSPDRFVEMLTLFYGGGTSFEESVDLGLKRLEDSNFRGADFIFLSDFDGLIDEEHLRQVQHIKKTTGFRWFTLLAPSSSHNQNLIELSDYIEEISLDFGEKTQITFKKFLHESRKRGGNR